MCQPNASLPADLNLRVSATALRPRQRLLELLHELHDRHTKRRAHLAQLDQIEPPFASLVLRYERLWTAKPLGEVNLAEFGINAKLPQHRDELLLLPAVDLARHRRIERRTIDRWLTLLPLLPQIPTR
jgi:hypothetical protein